MELLYSAQSVDAFEQTDAALDALRMLPAGAKIQRAARTAMHTLAQQGRHRIPPLDYLVAAAAEAAGAAVLHYDGHFDTLAEAMSFESVWIAPRSTVD